MSDNKSVAETLMKEWHDFKDTNEERLEALEKGDTARAQELDQKLEKYNERMDQLEVKMQKTAQPEQDAGDPYENEIKALNDFIRTDYGEKKNFISHKNEVKSGKEGNEIKDLAGKDYRHEFGFNIDSLPSNLKSYGRALQKKSLSSDSLADGGVFSLPNFEMDVVKGIRELSPVRQAARIITIGSGDSLTIPVRNNTIGSQKAGERENVSDTTTPKYKQVRIQTHERAASPAITRQMVEDSFMDIVAEVREDAMEEFAVQEGQDFISGTGNGEPEGMLTNADITSTDSGSNTAFDFDDLIDLQTSLKQGYNGAWMFSRQTRGYIRKLKDNDNQYLWSPNLAANAPNTLLGDPYFLATDLASPSSGSYSQNDVPVLYGDYQRGYYIVDRLGMDVLRDPYSNRPFIEIYMRKRYGGQVVLAEAIKKLTTTT